jgi:hypothetical protein
MAYVGRDLINVQLTAALFIRLASLRIRRSSSSLLITVRATRHSFHVTPRIV